MNIFDINGWEFVLILVVAVFVIGPERLPHYAAKLRGWIRQARAMADSAKGQLRDQMGPEFDDIDWQQFDPRQYDPRRIVREALLDEPADRSTGLADADTMPPIKPPSVIRYDPARQTPWDGDAT